MSTDSHRYRNSLAGFVFRTNWIFFDYDDQEVRFMHVVDGRRESRGFRD